MVQGFKIIRFKGFLGFKVQVLSLKGIKVAEFEIF
jgi:hypothetical protein